MSDCIIKLILPLVVQFLIDIGQGWKINLVNIILINLNIYNSPSFPFNTDTDLINEMRLLLLSLIMATIVS